MFDEHYNYFKYSQRNARRKKREFLKKAFLLIAVLVAFWIFILLIIKNLNT